MSLPKRKPNATSRKLPVAASFVGTVIGNWDVENGGRLPTRTAGAPMATTSRSREATRSSSSPTSDQHTGLPSAGPRARAAGRLDATVHDMLRYCGVQILLRARHMPADLIAMRGSVLPICTPARHSGEPVPSARGVFVRTFAHVSAAPRRR